MVKAVTRRRVDSSEMVLNAFSHRELQKACRRRELSAGGGKAALIRRLQSQTGRAMGADGIGYEITKASRTRRAFGLVTGLVASADRHLAMGNLGQLREICRMHDRQSALFSGLLDRALDNIYGSNFDFIPATGDPALNKIAKEYITKRMEAALASGLQDFAELARTTHRAIWTDGDCLLVKRPDGTLLPFEADQVETPGGGLGSTARIVLGVELGELNQPIAYHVRSRQSRGDSGMVGLNTKPQRIPASDALFPAYRKRHNQTRGVPFLAAALAFFDRTNNWLDYESLAAEGNSMLGFKIKREPTETILTGAIDNEDAESSGTFEKVQKMEPFSILDLAPGEDVDMVTSQRPGSNFEPYLVTCCRIIGVAVGFPLELIMLDFSRTNYSSARASLGEARRGFRVQQLFSAKRICMPWYRWQIDRGIASGELPAKAELYKARCQWPAWEYIDPEKEAKGNEVAIDNRTKSISECIRETGQEPDEVFAEIAEDNKKLAALGIMPRVSEGGARAGGEKSDITDNDKRDEEERRRQNE